MVGVVPVGVGLCSICRIDRRFLVIGIVTCQIRIGVVVSAPLRDAAVWLQSLVARWINDRTSRTGRTHTRAVLGRSEFSELVKAREPKIPIAVKDAVLCTATNLDGMAPFGNGQAVCQSPTVLGESLDLAAFIRTAEVVTETASIAIVDDNRRSCVRTVSRQIFVEVAAICEAHYL